jgi:hypothetical protein
MGGCWRGGASEPSPEPEWIKSSLRPRAADGRIRPKKAVGRRFFSRTEAAVHARPRPTGSRLSRTLSRSSPRLRSGVSDGWGNDGRGRTAYFEIGDSTGVSSRKIEERDVVLGERAMVFRASSRSISRLTFASNFCSARSRPEMRIFGDLLGRCDRRAGASFSSTLHDDANFGRKNGTFERSKTARHGGR